MVAKIIRRLSGVITLVALFLLAGCLTVPPIMNMTDLTKVDFSEVHKFRRGESCTTILLGLIPFGSTRITEAARDARIKTLKVIEYETRNYVFFSQFCVVASGI